MKVVVADDEPLARDLLRALLADIPDVTVVGEAENGSAVLEMVDQLSPDLVILDIQMPGPNGLQAAIEMNRWRPRPELIFVTAHDRHAADAFDIEAADYVLKPVRSHRLRQAIDRVRRRLSAALAAPPTPPASPDERDIWAPVRTGKVRVRLGELIRIQAAKDHAFIYTPDRSYLIRITMSALEETLAGTALQRVHRSAFVRLSAVREVRRDGKGVRLVVSDGSVVPVGGTYRAGVLAEIGHLAMDG